MLCVSVAPLSAQLGKVDLLNASRRADVVELCLDRLVCPYDVKDLLGRCGEQVIVACRRMQDGGAWRGTEDERLALLTQAGAAGAACVELDPDAARAVPRIGDTRRIIAFTSLYKPLTGVAEKIGQAANLGGDLVRFTWPTPTLDEAWPLLAIISRKHDLPVVVNGIGAAGRALAILGRKYGSPWIYAALERGMETHEGQPTVTELEDDWDWRNIGPQTEFAGVAGFGAQRVRTLQLLNAGFRQIGRNLRCLPLEIGDLAKLRQMLDLLHVTRIVTSRQLGCDLLPLAEHPEDAARAGNSADLLVRRDDGWHGYNLLGRTTFHVLLRTLRRTLGRDASLEGRSVVVLGAGHLAQAILFGLKLNKASACVASYVGEQDEVTFCSQCGSAVDRGLTGAAQVAHQMTARHVPFSQIGETRPDVVIAADPSLELGYGDGRLNPTWLRPPVIVADVARVTEESEFLTEARLRGCTVIRPSYIYAEEIAAQFQAITGEELPAGIFQDAVDIAD